MSKISKELDSLILKALKTFPEQMTRKEVIEHCERYVPTEPLIWITPATFAGHVMRHADCSFNRQSKRYTNYQVKDLKGRLRVL
jgi:hypothetical protein